MRRPGTYHWWGQPLEGDTASRPKPLYSIGIDRDPETRDVLLYILARNDCINSHSPCASRFLPEQQPAVPMSQKRLFQKLCSPKGAVSWTSGAKWNRTGMSLKLSPVRTVNIPILQLENRGTEILRDFPQVTTRNLIFVS